jgi:hypothetical protein
MANFSKILGLASTALVFAGMAFGQNPTCTGGAANQTPLVRVEGTTELVGEYTFTCGTAGVSGAGTANILDILSLPVTSKVLQTSGTAYTEAVAVVTVGGTVTSITQGTVSGSQVTFSGVALPAGVSTVTIANIRVNATSLTVGSGTPPAISESAFVSGTNVNSSVTTSAPVAYAFTGLSTQTVYKVQTLGSGNKGFFNFLVCQGYRTSAGLVGFIDVGENFATAFKGALPLLGGTNTALGSEFTNNTETGFQPASFAYASSGVTNAATTSTMLQVVFSNIPASVTLYVPTTVGADGSPSGAGSLTLVGSPASLTPIAPSTSSSAAAGTAALTATSGSATAYYLFTPGTASSSLTETFAIGAYVVLTANTVTASSTAMTAAVSFAPVGSTQIPNFVVGPSTTVTTLSTFTQCTTSLLFPFVTNQLGFDTGLAIANTSSDPFGSNGATAQAGTCTISFYGAGAPSPSSITTPNVPSGTVYTAVLSGIGAGFQGYLIAQCNFQYAHGFAFVTDGVGANGGLSQGYLAGVIPDTNQNPRTTANPIGSITTKGAGETLGN